MFAYFYDNGSFTSVIKMMELEDLKLHSELISNEQNTNF